MMDQVSASSGTQTSDVRSGRWWLAQVILVIAVIMYLVITISNFPHMLAIYQSGSIGIDCNYLSPCEMTPDGIHNLLVVPYGPAYRAGIRSTDTLVAIDGQPVRTQTLSNIYLTMMGEEGTQGTVTVMDVTGTSHDYSVPYEPGWTFRAGWHLQGLGVPSLVVRIAHLAVSLLIHVICIGGALILYIRSWKRWIAAMMAPVLILIPIFVRGPIIDEPTMLIVYRITNTFFAFIACLSLFIFPDGKLIPRWGWLIAALCAFFTGMQIFINGSIMIANLLVFIGVGAQIYRYRISLPETRQAQKWFAYGFSVSIIITVSFAILRAVIFVDDSLPIWMRWLLGLGEYVSVGVVILIPITGVVAILHYRLWDVDLIINRSVVGAGVTIRLIIIFLAGFFVLQTGLQAVLGSEQSAVAATLSVGIVLLVFNPVHGRVRHLIDRRLYGFRFDLRALKQTMPPITHPGALSGKTLGEFHIRDLIGKGGMGEVYQAHADGKTIALKIVPVDAARNPLLRQRMEREARALALLDHPNIVHFYGSGEFEDIFFIVLEFVQGQDLKVMLSERGKFSWSDVSPRVEEIASALDYAHQQGLVHRDIKPANIMLRRRAEVEAAEAVLMDFGIVKILDSDTQITGTGNVFGTIDYMAPEQILNAKEVDNRADIYAMGIVLYELLTGERPFKGSQGQVLFAHLQQPAPNPCTINAQIPPSVAYSILKALEKQPEDRYPSAAIFAQALLDTSVGGELFQ